MANIKKAAFAQFVQRAQFAQLFNELGWENAKLPKLIDIDGEKYAVNAVAQKRGFFIFTCGADSNGKMANYATRRKIDHQVNKLKELYVIIFTDKTQSEQLWQFTKRTVGKPKKVVETRCTADPESLYQKVGGLFFSMDEEDNITIIDVSTRVENNLAANADKVTKKFYDHFKREHHAFLDFIKGIGDTLHKDWYASLMLNRLMFCYFIQKKGFLDKNTNYLRDKLKESQKRQGEGEFYSFYRNFLLVLFHEGLNEKNMDLSVKAQIGRIPYLNGGLFDVHDLEQNYQIDISDAAFERIFTFFDQYDWHLDTRTEAKGNEINPDVIGYIFEKYINDRAQMGAYYTKEDITEYIAKNCIVPFLFDQTERNGAKLAPVWASLAQTGDRYIYPSLKHGFDRLEADDIPDEIAIGISSKEPNLMERRKDWNKPTPPQYGLPTEIWRETIDRWKRFASAKRHIEDGKVLTINDLITHNLDIRLFAEDVIGQTDDADFLRHLYTALSKVTILDPTCGSGAFLFAALNILEPLYEACLDRMAAFVTENPNKHRRFEEILADERDTTRHPNRQYFIFKKIIVQNLYGVDIMREATEIAKLRLFLKLMSTVEPNHAKPNMGLEPLPDVDFNIRAGNSLVGFATLDEAYSVIRHRDPLFAGDTILDISDAADKVKMAFAQFKSRNTEGGNMKTEKEKLKDELKKLNATLNDYLARNYLGDPYKPDAFNTWKDAHQPFHWCAEFYEVLYDDKGKFKGFDVVIGNPPYVVYNASKSDYKVMGYTTLECANLYAFCCERAYKLLDYGGLFGMILPNSSISADKMSSLQRLFSKENDTWISNYSWRPAKLFDGANMLLAIVISSKTKNKSKAKVHSTIYHKWYNDYSFNYLFECLSYHDASNLYYVGSIPKVAANIYNNIFSKMLGKSGERTLYNSFNPLVSKYEFYYFRAVLYWVKILDEIPVFNEDGVSVVTGEMKSIYTKDENSKYALIAILSSTLYFLHYIVWSSCQVINSRDFKMPLDFNTIVSNRIDQLSLIGKQLQENFQNNSKIVTRQYSSKGRNYTMEKQYFYIKKSKSLIDEIDKLLSAHYGFTEDELDFILNYDIKYRMGKELGDGEEE